jgi:hypothetical protein
VAVAKAGTGLNLPAQLLWPKQNLAVRDAFTELDDSLPAFATATDLYRAI